MTIQDRGIEEALDRDGYCVVKDVFSAEEIACMRDEVTAMLAIRASPHNGGISCNPERHEFDLACRLLSDTRLATCWAASFLPPSISTPIPCTIGMWTSSCRLGPPTAECGRLSTRSPSTCRTILNKMGSASYQGMTSRETCRAPPYTLAHVPAIS